jgi:hypothetical protein
MKKTTDEKEVRVPEQGEKDVQKESKEYNEQIPIQHPHGEDGEHNEVTPTEHPHDLKTSVDNNPTARRKRRTL